MVIVTLCAGLILLLAGGDALVRGSVAVASRLGVPPMVIGLTLVGFGTSMPELVASVQAAMVGAPAIAIGNVVGSNIANILLILGLSAVLLPMSASARVLRRDGLVLLAAAFGFTALALSGSVERWMGAILLLCLGIYTASAFLLGRRDQAAADAALPPMVVKPMALWLSLAITVGGICGIVVGADLLVRSAIAIADAAGFSQAVIGLTVVAVGTSLPELATSIVAALRRQGDVALGNVIGSNIFNVLGIAGITALVAEIPIPSQILGLDIWVMLSASLVLMISAVTARGISRLEGAVLLCTYVAYITLQFTPGLRAAIGAV